MLGAEKFYEYWENFGFTSQTGIELPGEQSGVFFNKSDFISPSGLVNLAVASFGQRFTTTPIKLITALSAVVNGGHLMEPYLVQSVTDSDGNVISYHEPTEVRQVISEETSATVRSILESVVNDTGGTGKNAKVDGYRIGGKTGSSQNTDSDDHIIVSFLGFAPANDPQVVVLLAYDWPQPAVSGGNTTASGTYISGGNMAAPMAGELIANILDYLGYQKTDTSTTGVTVPNLMGSDLDQAASRLSALGLNYKTSGEGTVVTSQAPSGGSSIPSGSTVVLYLGTERPDETVAMPDLTGMTYDEAKAKLESLGLYLNATGVEGGTVFVQTVDPGALLEVGTVVEVKFVDSSELDDEGANDVPFDE
jgi:stage V sporulation protein D (sporulation-specific penicillin-binding protein)